MECYWSFLVLTALYGVFGAQFVCLFFLDIARRSVLATFLAVECLLRPISTYSRAKEVYDEAASFGWRKAEIYHLVTSWFTFWRLRIEQIPQRVQKGGVRIVEFQSLLASNVFVPWANLKKIRSGAAPKMEIRSDVDGIIPDGHHFHADYPRQWTGSLVHTKACDQGYAYELLAQSVEPVTPYCQANPVEGVDCCESTQTSVFLGRPWRRFSARSSRFSGRSTPGKAEATATFWPESVVAQGRVALAKARQPFWSRKHNAT